MCQELGHLLYLGYGRSDETPKGLAWTFPLNLPRATFTLRSEGPPTWD